jgi:hypothetical protein
MIPSAHAFDVLCQIIFHPWTLFREPLVLIIREAQIADFRLAARSQSEQRVTAAVAEAFPADSERLGKQGMRQLVRLSITRAARHGFEAEREIFLFLSLMLMLGAFFDEDPQLPWAAIELAEVAGRAPFERISALHDMAMAYLDRLAGTENQHLIKALLRIRALALAEFDTGAPADFPLHVAAKLSALFPEKAALQGEQSLLDVCALAQQAAMKHGMQAQRDAGLFALLMFMLGHGFERDPQLSWVNAALADTSDPTAAQLELHRQALAFLEHGLASQSALQRS